MLEPSTTPGRLDHAYGERVHVLDSPFLATLLARFGGPDIGQGELLAGLRTLYGALFTAALDDSLPLRSVRVPTRMQGAHPDAGVWRGKALDPDAQLVFVDVIRAGIVPSQHCYELATAVLPDANLRIDHLTMARVADASGHVGRVDLSGSKVGGPVDGATLVFADPMGATGSTLLRALEHYREHHGAPARVLALPLIVTPEYLRAVLAVPEVTVHALRVDRGLSSPEVLAARPGERWDEERGLDEHDYIVPGAGGVGEVLNNAWC